MSTDGPDPTPCDPKVFEEGECVFITHTIPSNSMESWVKAVARDSKQPVDWHFAGGRAVVLALGDIEKVKASIRKLIDEHDARFALGCRAVSDSFGLPPMEGDSRPPRPDWS